MTNYSRLPAMLTLTGALLAGCAVATTSSDGSVDAVLSSTAASSTAAFNTAPSGVTPSSSAPSSPATTTGSSVLVAGPGPSGRYTVQPQPGPGTCHYRVLDATAGTVLPDPVCTPGATNPAVTPATLRTTICRSGYSTSIRPPAAITRREKTASLAAYGYTGNLHVVEYDHLVSLELGGDPNDPRNLWPEPNSTAATSFTNAKDAVENRLHALVCAGTVTLTAAQHAIATDWTTALTTVGTGA